MSSSESKTFGGADEAGAFFSGDFGDGAFGGEVAAEDADVAVVFDRIG